MTNTAVVPEQFLVKDCLHCCQGAQGGRYIAFRGTENSEKFAEGRYTVVDEFAAPAPGESRGNQQQCWVPVPQQQLVERITEMGCHIKRIREMVAAVEMPGDGEGFVRRKSVVHEALVAACERELRACYRAIAVLEGQCHGRGGRQKGYGEGMEEDGTPLTLRRVRVWLDEPTQRLAILESCLAATLHVNAGEAVNALHAMSKHGDPFVRSTVMSLLDAASVPYFFQLEQWITQGEVPRAVAAQHEEEVFASSSMLKRNKGQHLGGFMVLKLRTPRDHPYDVWCEGFAMDRSAQPKFIDDTLAKDIFMAGKNAHFLKEFCDDDDFNSALKDVHVKGQLTARADMTTVQRLGLLRQLAREAKDAMDVTLSRIIKEKESMMSHLDAIKRYVLLSQGDFVRIFIDLADEELRTPVEGYSEYTLQGHVEIALRSCGAAEIDVDVAECVRIRSMKEHQYKSEKDIGWNVFGLVYCLRKENAPLGVILDPASMNIYGEISQMLWTMKRAEHMVGLSWHDLDAISHHLATLKTMEREYGIEPESVVGQVPLILRYMHTLRADVAQFISSVQAHVVYQVIEPVWRGLEDDVRSAIDLEGLMRAHSKALSLLAKGVFCERRKSSLSSSSSTNEVKAVLQAALSAAIDVYIPVGRLTRLVHKALLDQKAFMKRIQESEKMGIWNEEACRSPPPIPDEVLEDVRKSAVRLHGIFDRHRKQFREMTPFYIT